MNAASLGEFVGNLIIHMAENQLPEVHKLVRRNRTATHFNLLLAFAWVSHVKLQQLLEDHDAGETVRMMLAAVMKRAMRITKWNYDVMRVALENRLEGYDDASSDEQGDSLNNITKYFVACCEELRQEVHYDEIIPDPEDLEELGDMVDPKALAQLKRMRREQRSLTYSLRLMDMSMVGASILSMGSATEKAVAEYGG